MTEPDPRPAFPDDFRAQLDRLFVWRRDVRHFRTDPVDPAVLDGLLATACLAPSVGLSEPWRFMRVDSPARRAAVRAEFARCNADALAARTEEDAARYATLKLAGLDRAPHHVAVFCDADPAQGRGLGRLTMPQTTVWSAVMAVHTFWLAATAAGLGVGWVSILDPQQIARILDADPRWTFLAYLCVGYAQDPSDSPELERRGWERRDPARRAWIVR
ncbi:cob(II)yrinic acid a,c-diamide reductase [Gluconacetobacter diazotrophicus PA1 5]|uniref:5,6-dimethylbenzimidazole synthase n=1 Tax=Gluconacetobacter diazotrophicus TaxID=33996 RepID=A0A7W4FCD1_GLUDI|nr:5,6-dimethylbenzimidazole synthase [Gluconacetobacter diazotrophicus]ACI51132.1 cob(II)yrinic acid a,c-diamide reductase [Gluconacetobacter diazotrophicus PA1 5]MBB2155154.1 5,6-dimethylbenzimidazole synthase [Gluconacetobacter diazotrophicus]TWB07593.1 cob(II)yrinic acid a,c-diamide reductase /5,6-dimethylbenzimidazole synthase [Gluconacetobacter diazotrophicus]